MLIKDGVEYRNLVEQVKQNQSDIQYLLKEGGTLNEFGIKVVGQVTTAADLPDPSTYEGEYGDAYAVGAESPYYFYIYTRQVSGQTGSFWFNVGLFPQLSTVPGPQGPQGQQGQQGTRGSMWFIGTGEPSVSSQYKTGDMYLNQTDGYTYRLDSTGNWRRYNSIRGPQGVQGLQGGQGPQGEQGPQGVQGAPFSVAGIVANVAQLPTPTAETLNQAYFVGTDGNYNLYVTIGTEEAGYLWVNAGNIASIEGPQGPEGPQGEQGPRGEDGITRPIYSTPRLVNWSTGGSIVVRELVPKTPEIAVGDFAIGSDGLFGRVTSYTAVPFPRVYGEVLGTLKGEAGASPTGITLTPASASQGTLTSSQLSTLQANDFNYITLNNEIYHLQDKSHEDGYLVYTHVGMDTQKKTFIKTITVTISTLGWVLTEKTVGGYLVNVIASNSNFKMYLSFQFVSPKKINVTNLADIGAHIFESVEAQPIAASGFYGNNGKDIVVSVRAESAGGAMSVQFAVTETFSKRSANIPINGTSVQTVFMPF